MKAAARLPRPVMLTVCLLAVKGAVFVVGGSVCGAEMGGARLRFSLPGWVLSVLGWGLVRLGGGDDEGYSTIASPEQGLYHEPRPEIWNSDFIHHPHYYPPPQTPITPPPPYLLLPVFRYHSAPAVSKDFFNPRATRRKFPSVLSSILIPQGRQPDIRLTPVGNNHGVEVRCGSSKISVRIHLTQLSFRGSAAHFRLGTCPASRALGSVLDFHYDLKQCGSVVSVINGKLVYSNKVFYRPESEGVVIRTTPLMLPIQCVYDRFYYSYKIGYLPELRLQSFQKTFVRKPVFSLSARNEKWEELGVNEGYDLRDLMYFEVAVDGILPDRSVYIDSCHVTSSEDPTSAQRYDVISNFGCMVDSKRTGSQSHYILRQLNVLRFALEAFLFADVASEHFYLHCTVLMGRVMASSTAKSCTYIGSRHRWEELDGDASICNCCDSQCRSLELNPSWVEQAVVTSKSWTLSHNVSSETSEWPNAVLGSVLLYHPEEEVIQDEEVVEDEELEEVLLSVADTENEVMWGKEEDAVKMLKEEVYDYQKDEQVMQENVTDSVGIREGEEPLKWNTSVSAVEMDLPFRGKVSEK